jgi:hypothetical protein
MYFCAGEMAERFNAAVLKTVDCNRSGGSNPSLSASNKCKHVNIKCLHLLLYNRQQNITTFQVLLHRVTKTQNAILFRIHEQGLCLCYILGFSQTGNRNLTKNDQRPGYYKKFLLSIHCHNSIFHLQ